MSKSPTTGTIRIFRYAGHYRDALRSYIVEIDEQRVGKLRPGDTAEFDVPPGRHAVRLRVDIGRSEQVEVDVCSGATVQLNCAPSGAVGTALSDLLKIWRRPWVALWMADVAPPARKDALG